MWPMLVPTTPIISCSFWFKRQPWWLNLGNMFLLKLATSYIHKTCVCLIDNLLVLLVIFCVVYILIHLDKIWLFIHQQSLISYICWCIRKYNLANYHSLLSVFRMFYLIVIEVFLNLLFSTNDKFACVFYFVETSDIS